MIYNTGVLAGPFISTQLLEKIGYEGIFVFLILFNSFIFVSSLIGLRNVNHRFDKKLKVMDVIKKVIKKKDIMRIYNVSFALEFFYVLTVIYIPIYLIDLGFTWDKIGLILTIMLIPFVIIQYPIGLLADKKTGEKELLFGSILLMGLTTIALFFVDSRSVLFWGMILFANRVGAALVEILRDSYFYKKIDGSDVDVISFYKTAVPVGSIAATTISVVLLIFFPIKSVFILVVVVVLLSVKVAYLVVIL